MTISVGITSQCFGILFLSFLNDLGASTTLVASIFNTESFLWSCSNLLGGPLVEVYGFRSVAMLGSLLTAVGLGTSAFAPSPHYLFFSHSLLTGIGSGLCCLVSFAIIPHYFKRLRGRANALMTTGVCLAGMFGPPIITYLQQQYGFRGATIIIAAFVLNNCVAATVFHPVAWHKRAIMNAGHSKSASEPNLSEQLTCNANTLKNASDTKLAKQSNWNTNCSRNEIKETNNGRIAYHSEKEENGKQINIYEADYDIELIETIGYTEGNLNHGDYVKKILSINDSNCQIDRQLEKSKNQRTRILSKPIPSIRIMLGTVLSTLVENIKVLRSATAVLISIGGSFIIGVYLNFAMLVPFAMEAAGYTQEEASWGLSVSSTCNLLARLLMSTVADLPIFSVHKVYLASNAIITLATVGFSMVEGVLGTNLMLGVWGFGIGMCFSLHPLLLVHFMGLRKFMAILGVSGILNGLWLLAAGPLLGMIRDVSGSYTVTLCALASTAIITIVLFIFLPYTRAQDTRKEEERHSRRKKEELVEVEGGARRMKLEGNNADTEGGIEEQKVNEGGAMKDV